MSEPTQDRAHPDHDWTGNGSVASNDDLAQAVAHMKAWFTREIAAFKTAPSVTALETKVADLESRLKAMLSPSTPPVSRKGTDA